jgi:DNA-binding protein H-NS
MANPSFQAMTIDELWAAREEISQLLAAKLTQERELLEQRLAQLRGKAKGDGSSKAARRPYPKVVPQYQNPANPAETWSGRGKRPRWLTAQLKSGKRIGDFRIRRRGK